MNNDLKELEEKGKLKFICPKCGKIDQDQVVFLCNHCQEDDVIEKDGIYICPKCLLPGENFECMSCGSKDVKLSPKDRSELKNIA
jgi:Zn finger protein HypA/HybF involved in hydrogenase expression